MSQPVPVSILAVGAALGLALLPVAFGPSLLRHYQVAAQAEMRPLSAQAGSGEGAPDTTADAPLFDSLSRLSYVVSTTSQPAQRHFDQGLRLAYAFDHAAARRAFQAAQRYDPECAMCYWGEALVLGPNINAPMDASAVASAAAALRRAEGKAKYAVTREQAMIAALAKRYSDDPQAERAVLDAAYAAAMGEVAARFRDDDEIQVLHAAALMHLAPSDYWEAGGTRPKGRTGEIIAALETVLARNPDHPGAIRYYIHIHMAKAKGSAAPQRALPSVRRLAAAMPGSRASRGAERS
jgi:hypothetical protein